MKYMSGKQFILCIIISTVIASMIAINQPQVNEAIIGAAVPTASAVPSAQDGDPVYTSQKSLYVAHYEKINGGYIVRLNYKGQMVHKFYQNNVGIVQIDRITRVPNEGQLVEDSYATDPYGLSN